MKKKDVTDSEIEQLMRPVLQELSRHLVKREPIEEDEPQQAKKKKPKKKSRMQGGRKSGTQGGNVSGRQGDSEHIVISEEEKDCLVSVFENPIYNLSAHRNRLAYSADKFSNVKTELLNSGLVDEFSVDLGKDFGGRVKMLSLTDKGYKALNKKQPKKPSSRQGSLEHQFWANQIEIFYRQNGFKASLERTLNGKAADVGIQKNGEVFAVEIELSPKNCLYNFKTDIDAGFAKVIVACKNQNVKNQSEKMINAFMVENPEYEGKAKIMMLNEFSFTKSLGRKIRGS